MSEGERLQLEIARGEEAILEAKHTFGCAVYQALEAKDGTETALFEACKVRDLRSHPRLLSRRNLSGPSFRIVCTRRRLLRCPCSSSREWRHPCQVTVDKLDEELEVHRADLAALPPAQRGEQVTDTSKANEGQLLGGLYNGLYANILKVAGLVHTRDACACQGGRWRRRRGKRPKKRRGKRLKKDGKEGGRKRTVDGSRMAEAERTWTCHPVMSPCYPVC